MITVRISRGAFNPDDYDRIAKLLDASRLTLDPAFDDSKDVCITGRGSIAAQIRW